MALDLKKLKNRRRKKKRKAIRDRNKPKDVKSLGKILPGTSAGEKKGKKPSLVKNISGKSKKIFKDIGKKIPGVKKSDIKELFQKAKSRVPMKKGAAAKGAAPKGRRAKLQEITSSAMGQGGGAALKSIIRRARRTHRPMVFNYYPQQQGEREVVREVVREQAPQQQQQPIVVQPQVIQAPAEGGPSGESMFQLEKAAVKAAHALEKTIAAGIVIPESQNIRKKVFSITSMPKEWSEKSKRDIYEHYNLIPAHPKPGEPVFASATVRFSEEDQTLLYSVDEPPMNSHEIEVLRKVEDKMEEKLDVSFDTLALVSQKDYLRNQISDIIDMFGYSITDDQRAKVEYYIFRDFIGMGKIEPIMHDPNIEDISCDGIGIPVYIFHRNPTYGQMKTNVVYLSKEDIDSFVMKLSQKCGKSISVATPLLDGTLPDGSRVQATLGSDIARRGSNFTIRKFTENPFTPIDLMRFSTLDSMGFAFLWLCIEYGKSILIAGTTATGKTTLLNAISLFIRPEMKIVSIEDTGELQLPHPNWIPETARSGMGEAAYGAVEMYDLLKAALRQRPEYVIVGEVRGKEASVMFQGMATGHPSMGTIHADNVQRVVDRLVTPPISLSAALLENLDVIVFLVRSKVKGEFQRRVLKITEVKGVDVKNGRIIPNDVFQWDPIQDQIFPMNPSLMLAKLAAFKGTTEESVKAELERRAMLLEFLARMNVSSYEAFAYYINQYYANPDALFKQMRG